MPTFMVFSDFILQYQFLFAKIHSLFVCDLFISIHLCLYFWLSFFTKNDLQEVYKVEIYKGKKRYKEVSRGKKKYITLEIYSFILTKMFGLK